MDGVDRRLVEGGRRGQGGGAAILLQLFADAGPQLRGGGFREGDRDQLGRPEAARGDQGHDPVDEGRRLASSGAGFDEEGGVEVFAEPSADCLVGGELGDHRGGSSRRPWWRLAPGSSRLRSRIKSRPVGQIRW